MFDNLVYTSFFILKGFVFTSEHVPSTKDERVSSEGAWIVTKLLAQHPFRRFVLGPGRLMTSSSISCTCGTLFEQHAHPTKTRTVVFSFRIKR